MEGWESGLKVECGMRQQGPPATVGGPYIEESKSAWGV